MNNQSLKTRIYRIAYAVIGFAVIVAVTMSVSQFFVARYGHQTDSASQGIRFINRSEMNYAYYLGDLRSYLLHPENKKSKELSLDHAKKGFEDLQLAVNETSDAFVHEHAKKVEVIDKSLDPIEDKIYSAIEKGDRQFAEKVYLEEHVPTVQKLVDELTSVRTRLASEREAAIENRERAVMVDLLLMAFVLIVSTLGIVIYSFRLARSIAESLEKISEELSLAAGSVRQASGNVSTASQALSESTTQQAAAIEETVSSMEEMSSMLSQTSQNTQTTLAVAEEGQQEGERGKAVISKMLTAMDEIHASNERLESIVKMIEEIQSKTKVINDIVFETRLLSFNASIEAARAGAHGKGFAVVAEEVGKLATMSGKAAEEIRTLLERSTAEVSSVVRGTQDRVNAGRQVSQDCQAVFEIMSVSLSKIGESVRMITAATKEQEVGVKQTNQAMAEMDQVTQRNSSSAESLASQATNLSLGATHLIGSVDRLKSIIFGLDAPAWKDASRFDKDENLETTLPLKAVHETSVPKTMKISDAESKTGEHSRSDSRWKVA